MRFMFSFVKGTLIGAFIGAVIGLMSSNRTRKRFRRSAPCRMLYKAYDRIEDMF